MSHEISTSLHVLVGWREDALPRCSASTCSREIKNGDRYGIPRGSIYLLCQTCFVDPQVRTDPRPLFGPPLPQLPRRRRVPRRAGEQPWRHGPPPPDPVPCPVCEQPFIPYRQKGGQPKRFCSRRCGARGRVQRPVVRTPSVCPACDQEFWPTNGKTGITRCCSRPCAQYHFRGKPNPNPTPRPWTWTYPHCLDCKRTDRPPRGRGYCSICFMRRWPNKGRHARSPGGGSDERRAPSEDIKPC